MEIDRDGAILPAVSPRETLQAGTGWFSSAWSIRWWICNASVA